MPTSALDLGELGYELAAVDLAGDGLTLRVKAEATRALAVSGDAVVGDEGGQGSGHVQILNAGLDLYTGKKGGFLPVTLQFIWRRNLQAIWRTWPTEPDVPTGEFSHKTANRLHGCSEFASSLAHAS